MNKTVEKISPIFTLLLGLLSWGIIISGAVIIIELLK